MRVTKGTYRISLWNFINSYYNIIKDVEYTPTEAHDCIEMFNGCILQYLKVYVINNELKSCGKMLTIARDFINNKFSDRSGRYFNEYTDEERFFFSHVLQLDYMEITCDDDSKIERLVDFIEIYK